MQAQTTLEELFALVPRARGVALHPELFDMWLARAERLSVRLPADDAPDAIFYVLSLTGIGAYAQLPGFVDARTMLVSDIHSLVQGVRHAVRSTCAEFTDPTGQVPATAALVKFIYQDVDRRRLFFQMCSLFAEQLEQARRLTELANWPEVPFKVIGARQVELLGRAKESSQRRYGLTDDLALGLARIAQEAVRHCAKPSFYEYKDLMLALCQVVRFIDGEVAETQKSDQLVMGSFEELVALRLSSYPVFLKLVLHFSGDLMKLIIANYALLEGDRHFREMATGWKETLEREGAWFRATDLTE